MRILRISGENLASLERPFTIDFQVPPLRDAGLFAITGPTGSGKSTILDAVYLALFGQVPRLEGVESKENPVPDVNGEEYNASNPVAILRRGATHGRAEVLFEGVDGRVYTAVWSVRRAYGRPDGKIQDAEQKLLDAEGNIVARSTREVKQRIVELVGMHHTQFQHVVLLAQGKFAEFLKAKSRDKSELLERITNTELFSRIGMEIYHRHAAVVSRKKELSGHLASIVTCGDEELEAMRHRKEQVRQRMGEVEAEMWQHQDAIKVLEALRELEVALRTARGEAEAAKAKLEELAPARRLCEQWAHAEGIRPTMAELQHSRKEKDKQQRVVEDCQNKLPGLRSALEREREKATGLEERSGELEGQRLGLERLRVQVESLDRQLETSEGEVQRAKEEWNGGQQEGQRLGGLMRGAKKELEQAKDQQAGDKEKYEALLPKAQLWEALDGWVGPIGEYPQLCATHEAKGKEAETMRGKMARLKHTIERETKALEELEAAVSSEVLHLRSSLEEGKPCPVCGSTTHPIHQADEQNVINMAELEAQRSRVSKQLDTLREQHTTLGNKLSHQEGELSTVEGRLQQVLAALAPHFEPLYPDYASGLRDISLCQKLVKRAKDFAEVRQRCAQHEQTVEGLQKQLDLHREAHTKQLERLGQLEQTRTARTEAHQELVSKRGQLLGGQTIEGRELALKREEERLSRERKEHEVALEVRQKAITEHETLLTNAQAEVKRLATVEKDLREDVASWLGKSELLGTMQELVDILRVDRETIAGHERQIASAERNHSTANAVWKERQQALERKRQELSGVRLGELDGVRTQLADCQAKHQLLDQERIEAEREIGVQENLRGLRATLKHKLDKLERRNKPLAQLNELFGDPQGAKFRKYAQARNMDNLIAWANIYLRGIMPRYSLEMTGSDNLLSLMVVDGDLADTKRHVSSLSGGETFVISLAFALALSELAASSEQQLEMLFIDEGFGTLDDTTLNLVSEALNRMQQSGRKVGFISHVQQLTERMPVRIEVRPTSAGASRISISEH
ncbi:MAG: hypothetical protein CSA07_03045 [Bacteroidia bacterium]|nr:MAG: hypothetical protein CSA07_03045 [Bacteroidia bacterium]